MNILQKVTVAFFLFSGVGLWAQPVNDDCSNPIRITDITKFCSKVGEFTNVKATPSGYGAATCWTASNKDVWFVFRAIATDISITIRGVNARNPGNAGGTLQTMNAALYVGVCGGTLNQIACASDVSAAGVLSLNKGTLVVGKDYLLRVDGRNNAEGTFQICINNFFPPAEAEQDCRSATVLCNNNPFVNPKLSGPGVFNDEASGSCLGEGLGVSEDQSSWYTWIAKSDCRLTFTITPLNQGDDLDFALYELPSGIHNCSDKKLLRCNATHPTAPGLFCGYTTGLNLNSKDTVENLNCDAGEDGFCKYIDMKAGTAYTLVINNFTSSGIGFSLEFGDCEFQGPEPEFKIVPDSGLRCETFFDVRDFSTFVAGKIISYEWNFGVDAVPPDANTAGPHQVSYNSFGEKFITLTLTTDLGCKISKVKRIVADPCCEDLPDLKAVVDSIYDVHCFGEKNGRVVFKGVDGNPYTDQITNAKYYTFSLDGINFSPLTSLSNLSAGKYRLYIQDRKGCVSYVDFEIKQPPPVTVDAGPDTEINLGDELTLHAAAQPDNPYIYNWTQGGTVVCNNCQSTTIQPFKEGYYVATATDQNGCTGMDSLYIRVRREYNLYVPNVISANGDGVNDYFVIKANAALESIDRIDIYDRWGGRTYGREKVSRSELDKLWDGTFNGEKVNPGVFTYVIVARFIDGTLKDFGGDITVLR